MRTPENIVRHELIGLKAEVVESSNPKNIGISGRVVDETRNMLILEKADGRKARLVKEENVFVFKLGDKKVRIEGRVLVGRPEDRIKKKFRKW